MKARVKYIFAPLLIAATTLAPITIVSAGGQIAQQRLSSTDPVECLSIDPDYGPRTQPSSIGFRGESDEQYEAKLRYIVEPQEGKVAVATLFYTGYEFQPELLEFESLPTPVAPR